MPGVEHRRGGRSNNRAENSHQPTREHERRMRGSSRCATRNVSCLCTERCRITFVRVGIDCAPGTIERSCIGVLPIGKRSRALDWKTGPRRTRLRAARFDRCRSCLRICASAAQRVDSAVQPMRCCDAVSPPSAAFPLGRGKERVTLPAPRRLTGCSSLRRAHKSSPGFCLACRGLLTFAFSSSAPVSRAQSSRCRAPSPSVCCACRSARR